MAKPGKKRSPAPAAEPARITAVTVAMQRVYSIGRFKTLRYDVQAQGEVQSGHDASDAVDQLTAFLDAKVAQFAADRDLDHLVPNRDSAAALGSEFEEKEEDENDPDYDDEGE